MRSTMMLLGLTGLVLATTAGDAAAQRRGRGWANTASNAMGYGNYGNYGYGNYGYGSGYNNSYYGGGYPSYGYNNSSYYTPYVGNSYSYASPSYYTTPSYGYTQSYYTTPSYSYATPSYSQPMYSNSGYAVPQTTMNSGVVQSSYYNTDNQNNNNVARVRVILPSQDAQLWISDVQMQGGGMERMFQSPPLEQGKSYMYRIRAQWNGEGRAMDRTREVEVRAGQEFTVNFRDTTGTGSGTGSGTGTGTSGSGTSGSGNSSPSTSGSGTSSSGGTVPSPIPSK